MFLVLSSDAKSFCRLRAAGAYLLESGNKKEVVQKNVENQAVRFVLFLSVAGEYLYVHVFLSLCDAECFRRMKAARAYLPGTRNK